MSEFVSYLRVSTEKQGRSGLGLDAQRSAVSTYLCGRGQLLAEFVEIESGKNSERAQLSRALAFAKKHDAILLIAKLDRLARNVAFIANLLEGKVEVAAADMPEANRFVLHIMAAVAEQEGRAISERTRAALQAAKAKGVKLGWSNPDRADEQARASKLGVKKNVQIANQKMQDVWPEIEKLIGGGSSLNAIARELNRQGIPSARGGGWYAKTVSNLIERHRALASS